MYVIYKIIKSKTSKISYHLDYVCNEPVGRSVCLLVNNSGSVITWFCCIPVKYCFYLESLGKLVDVTQNFTRYFDVVNVIIIH